MSIRGHFSDADLETIRRATQEAEKRTSGELVVFLVGRVDEHDEAVWKGATLGALAAVLIAALVHWQGGYWGGTALFWITLPALLGAAGGYLLPALVPAIERTLITDATLDERVARRADAAFLSEEVWQTRERTGILILLAMFEHRAVILPDEGIRAKVDPGAWQALVDDLVAGIRAGRAVPAILETIDRCGALLERHGVERRADDADELANRPRIEER